MGLPNPEAVFDIQYFRHNPKPCTSPFYSFSLSPIVLITVPGTVTVYTLARDMQPGKFRPTLGHSFVRLIHEKGLLHACFTQNIDTLERRAGIPETKLIEAHGSFASHHCIDCDAEYDNESMMDAVEQSKIPRCRRCRGLVKPDIVFFGESVSMLCFVIFPNMAFLTSEYLSFQSNS